MKLIVIDSRLSGNITGIGKYAYELVKNLALCTVPDNKNIKYIVVVNENSNELINSINLPPHFEIIKSNTGWYTVKEQTTLRALLYKIQPDLTHFLQLSHPLFYKLPYIVTAHDITPLFIEQGKTALLKSNMFRIYAKEATINSRIVISDSEYTKNDLIKYLKTPASKIKIVYLGVSKSNQSSSGKEALSKYQIKQPYILYVGQQRPHKNIKNLISAFHIFSTLHTDYSLVLAGSTSAYTPIVVKEIHELDLNSKIILTGYVSEPELKVLYQNACAYIVPSFYEGFGLTPLEAMKYGVPVLSSNTSCMSEILGDSVLYFDPYNPKDIAAAMDRIIMDSDLRDELIKSGCKRVKEFAWEKTANKILDLYSEILDKKASIS